MELSYISHVQVFFPLMQMISQNLMWITNGQNGIKCWFCSLKENALKNKTCTCKYKLVCAPPSLPSGKYAGIAGISWWNMSVCTIPSVRAASRRGRSYETSERIIDSSAVSFRISRWNCLTRLELKKSRAGLPRLRQSAH
ncbi:hypothetical protein GDO81_028716 [Engystomops pustulosus]|uniref:Uncharacterized protein n=1 Tax=Engystomops pustulosus TaxID=76066 RepID=A0AAV6ZDK7_ENGPU|nr:hypothetical protein GDO81_028716 [Engystomops pustulosus]